MRLLLFGVALLGLAACSSSEPVATRATADLPNGLELRTFTERLAYLESSGDAFAVNAYGFLGKYQMGECALIDAGFYFYDATGCRQQDWIGSWTGAMGVHGPLDFLYNADAQDTAVHLFMSANWAEIHRRGLDTYVGQSVRGVRVTEAGLLAGAHLGGVGGLETFLLSDGLDDPGDANGTTVSRYISLFAEVARPAMAIASIGECGVGC